MMSILKQHMFEKRSLVYNSSVFNIQVNWLFWHNFESVNLIDLENSLLEDLFWSEMFWENL